MTVIKNKSTLMNRDFWSHVESIAEQSRTSREAPQFCRSAAEVVSTVESARTQSDQRASTPTSSTSDDGTA